MLILKPCVSRSEMHGLAFSPDSRALAAPASHDGVMLWRTFAGGAKAERVATSVFVSRLAFTPDGCTLFAGYDHLAAVDLAAGRAEVLPIAAWHGLWFGVSPDGSRLVAVGEDRGQSCRATCWAVGAYAEPLWEATVPGLVRSNPLFIGADRFVLCEYRRHGTPHWFANRVTYSLETGAELDVSGCLQDLPEVVALSPDGARVACGTRETIRTYPTVGGVLDFAHVKNDGRKHFTALAFHPSGKYLAAASNDATIKLYDTSTWEVARTFTWDIGKMRSVAFSPNGTLAAAGSDKGKVVVWDVDL